MLQHYGFPALDNAALTSGIVVAAFRIENDCKSEIFCLISIVAGTPVGSTIVAIDLIVFLMFAVIGKICGGRK